MDLKKDNIKKNLNTEFLDKDYISQVEKIFYHIINLLIKTFPPPKTLK